MFTAGDIARLCNVSHVIYLSGQPWTGVDFRASDGRKVLGGCIQKYNTKVAFGWKVWGQGDSVPVPGGPRRSQVPGVSPWVVVIPPWVVASQRDSAGSAWWHGPEPFWFSGFGHSLPEKFHSASGSWDVGWMAWAMSRKKHQCSILWLCAFIDSTNDVAYCSKWIVLRLYNFNHYLVEQRLLEGLEDMRIASCDRPPIPCASHCSIAVPVTSSAKLWTVLVSPVPDPSSGFPLSAIKQYLSLDDQHDHNIRLIKSCLAILATTTSINEFSSRSYLW